MSTRSDTPQSCGAHESRIADTKAREAARTVFATPVVLEAGAGTGKTTALVARVVAWLIDEGIDRAGRDSPPEGLGVSRTGDGADATLQRAAARALDGVLAITFTEAAAADMDAKIRAALATLEAGGVPIGMETHVFRSSPVQSADRARALRLALERPVAQTIHAWCRTLLAEHPLEAGLHPAFEVDPQGRRVAEVARACVTRELASRLGPHPDPDWLVLAARNHGPRAVEEALTGLVMAGQRAVDLEKESFPDVVVASIEDRFWSEVDAFLRECAVPLERLRTSKAKTGAKVLDAVRSILTLRTDREPSVARLSALTRAVKVALEPALMKRLRAFADLDFLQGEADALGDDRDVVGARARGLLPVLQAFVSLDPELERAARRILARLVADARACLVAAGVETFGDLLRDAHDLLSRDVALCARIRATLEQVLVDEFQDTDPLQCDIVDYVALDATRGRRPGLFIVGDPKQSIYGWRRADLAAYDRFVGKVLSQGGVMQRLTLNFRSRQGILDHVDHVLMNAMQHEPGVQPEFQSLVAHRVETGGTIEWWNAWTYDGGPRSVRGNTPVDVSARLEGNVLARELRASHERGIDWKDMGVLVRAMTGVDTLLEALRAAAIPFEVAGDRSYYRRREILDAAALFASVVDPGDHVALVTFLRSPFVGAPDALLLPLWSQGFQSLVARVSDARPETLAPVRRAIAVALREMPSDVPGIERISGFEALLDHAIETLGLLRASFTADPVDAFIERARLLLTLEASAGARFQGAYRVANIERFFSEVEREMEATGGDAHALVRFLRARIASAPDTADARPRDAAQSAVQIMTIHKSKGLDFAEVFVLGLHRGRRGGGQQRNRRAETACEGAAHVLLGAPSPDWLEAKARAEKRESAERVRLLYVAMTRAKDRLVLSGTWSPKAMTLDPGSAKCLMDLAEPAVDAEARAFFDGWSGTAATSMDFRGVRYRLSVEEPLAPDGSRSETDDRERARTAVEHAQRLGALRLRAIERQRTPSSRRMSATNERAAADEEPSVAQPAGQARGPAAPIPRAPIRRAPVPARLAAQAGVALHALLEAFRLDGDLDGEAGRARLELPQFVAATFGNEGLADDRAAVLDSARSLYDAFVAGPLFRHFGRIAAHVVAREVPILARRAAPSGAWVLESGAIDLLYRDPATGELVVVDYKTDRVRDAGEARERVAHHRAQLDLYRTALREALALQAPPRAELWFLAISHVEPVA